MIDRRKFLATGSAVAATAAAGLPVAAEAAPAKHMPMLDLDFASNKFVVNGEITPLQIFMRSLAQCHPHVRLYPMDERGWYIGDSQQPKDDV